MDNWLTEPFSTLVTVFFSVLLIFSIIIIITRMSGLRTFAKMSSFDFASTIAVGSILASVVMNTGQSIVKGTVALGTVIAFQTLFSYMKRKSDKLSSILTNAPMLIMDGNKILYENLAKTNVSEEDLIAKLREANVRNFDEVLAVVLESTGDVSVIHSNDGMELDKDQLLLGVERQ
ncbi:MAG: YetF domain-containing protein [Pricia sp.]